MKRTNKRKYVGQRIIEEIWKYDTNSIDCWYMLYVHRSSTQFYHSNIKYLPKGGLISEGILSLVPLPTKGAKAHPWAEHLNFPPITVNKLHIQIFCSGPGNDFAPFVGNGTNIKRLSETKPPLCKQHNPTLTQIYCKPLIFLFVLFFRGEQRGSRVEGCPIADQRCQKN